MPEDTRSPRSRLPGAAASGRDLAWPASWRVTVRHRRPPGSGETLPPGRNTWLSLPAVRRLACAAPLAAGLAVAATVIPAGVASAATAVLPSNCTQSGAAVTCGYGYTGAEQTFVVPRGVTQVQVDAIGAAGQGSAGGPGGEGAQVTGTLGGLSGGQLLDVEVGGVLLGSGAPAAPATQEAGCWKS